jgi:rhodanese-related sulfurtransferase
MELKKIIRENQCTIIDVRTPEEFVGGNAGGSRNIPLQEIPTRMEEIKKLTPPLLLCCASGGRSGQARRYLAQNGIESCNGGSWLDVKYYQTQTN